MSNLIEENGTYFLVKENKKANNPATYKQYELLSKLSCVEVKINTSQFMKYCDRYEASEAIELAIKGEKVVVE